MADTFKSTQAKAKAKAKDSSIPGKMPRSQAISTFGVGSIYELRSHRKGGAILHSVMIAGLDWWPLINLQKIREPELEKSLGVKYFHLPPAESEDGSGGYVPAVRFPRWLACNRCNRLGQVPREFEDIDFAGPRCRASGCRGRGMPGRLVMACFSKRGENADEADDIRVTGHIDDFPWVWWAHSKNKKTCSRPQLKLETDRNTTSISGLTVRCYSEECRGETGRSLEGVFGVHALEALKCNGSRPWLHDREDNCNNKVRTLLRGASNVYFPVTASAISIPPSSEKLQQLLYHQGHGFVDNVGKVPMETIVGMLKNSIPQLDRYDDSEIADVLMQLKGDGLDRTARSEQEQRSAERKAILRGRVQDEEAGEFVAEPLHSGLFDQKLGVYLDSLVRVHRLREVRALRGFQRVEPFAGEDLFTVPVAPLSIEPKEWLPAIEVHGEGLYLELDSERVREWEGRRGVVNRIRQIRGNCRKAWESRGIVVKDENLPTARLVMIHTLSHLLMKQLSLTSGYSGASLRERLFVGRDGENNDELGFLVYTAGAGADGTLGGLVRQGKPGFFEGLFQGALENACWCSSDPLCMESTGQGFDALNLSACHACSLVAETSCERRNSLLDRALLIGHPDIKSVGFFEELL